jgi:hypothetical protein
MNPLDGLYHHDEEDPKSKRDFAEGGVVGGANSYLKKHMKSLKNVAM